MMIMRLTIRQVFFALLFLGLFLMTLYPVADPDFWWHLRTGQLIVQTHTIPHVDPFSFTNTGKPWTTHEWLTEIFIYGLFKIGSYGLLIFIFSLFITGAFLLAYLRSSRESRPYVAGFTLLLGAIATAPTWGVRPQMISLFITSLVLYLLDRYRTGGKLKYIVPFPFITMVWVNLHAGYFLGLAIMTIYIFGSLIELLQARLQKTAILGAPTLKSVLLLCVALGCSILAALVNPNGVHILLYPFQTLTSQAMQQFIVEWFSPDFHQLQWQPLAWFILAFIGAGMFGKKPVSPTKILITLVFGYAALRSMRFVPLFAIVTIPILSELIDSVIRIRSGSVVQNRLFRWMAPIILVVSLLIVGFRFVQVVQGQPKSEGATFPKAAVNWIAENQPPGNLFNSYGWGGYIIWRLYPQYLVYIDGRADVYGDKFIYEFREIYHAEPGWEQALDTQRVTLVLVEPDSGLANALRQSTGWELAFEDQISMVFFRK